MTTARRVYYPESDGKPMAETPIHRDDMVRVIHTLRDAMADRPDVYVSGNMMFYYEEGNPRVSVSPDVFVVKGVPKTPEREVFKLWEEAVPAFVMELTSRWTRRQDLTRKRDLYARMGIPEYFLYDPLGDYLRPPLQGFRLVGRAYEPIEPDAAGGLTSTKLGVRFLLNAGRLELYDVRTGTLAPDPETRTRMAVARAEAEAARAEAEAARAEAEAEARRAAEARVAELEARLREPQPPPDP